MFADRRLCRFQIQLLEFIDDLTTQDSSDFHLGLGKLLQTQFSVKQETFKLQRPLDQSLNFHSYSQLRDLFRIWGMYDLSFRPRTKKSNSEISLAPFWKLAANSIYPQTKKCVIEKVLDREI